MALKVRALLKEGGQAPQACLLFRFQPTPSPTVLPAAASAALSSQNFISAASSRPLSICKGPPLLSPVQLAELAYSTEMDHFCLDCPPAPPSLRE